MAGPDPTSIRVGDVDVRLPCEVREARALSLVFLVDAGQARGWLPDGRLEVVPSGPGKASLTVTFIDYIDNDLGDYLEVSVALVVREVRARSMVEKVREGRDMATGKVSTWIRWLPVSQQFTRDAGEQIWGFPKTVDDLALDVTDGVAEGSWHADGRHVLTMRGPATGTKTQSPTPLTTYTTIDGALHATTFTTAATGVGVKLGGGEIELGDHPHAVALRTLGLPKRPVMATWFTKMSGTFAAPRPVLVTMESDA